MPERAEIRIKRQGRDRIRWEFEDRGYETPCWIWTGARQSAGYGCIRLNGRTQQAHRLMVRGGVPDDLQVDHLCRVRECVNPDHLEVVTNAENQRRGVRAKLSVAAAQEIRERVAQGEATRVLAAIYGVNRSTIRRIVNRRSWA